MAQDFVPVDISSSPELIQIAEIVRETGKPLALQRGGETIAVVRPAPKKRQGRRGSRAGEPSRLRQPPMDDPDLAKIIEADLRANREASIDREALFAPPTPELTARRAAVLAQIEQHLPERNIAPLTAADLVHIAR